MTAGKILLIVGLGFGVLMAIIIGGIFVFVHFTVDDNFRREEEAKRTEGAEFGKATDQAGCLAEGLKRSKTVSLASSFLEQVKLEVFVEGCFPESRPTPEFCERVPADYNLPALEPWKTKQCEKAGLSESSTGCDYVFEQQINFCSRRAK